jgi:hypothetical protein
MSVQKLRAYLTKPETVRQSNDQIAEKAARYHFVSRFPTLCECGEPGCTRLIPISADAYREIRRDPHAFLTAVGHTVEGAVLQREEADYSVVRRRSG